MCSSDLRKWAPRCERYHQLRLLRRSSNTGSSALVEACNLAGAFLPLECFFFAGFNLVVVFSIRFDMSGFEFLFAVRRQIIFRLRYSTFWSGRKAFELWVILTERAQRLEWERSSY